MLWGRSGVLGFGVYIQPPPQEDLNPAETPAARPEDAAEWVRRNLGFAPDAKQSHGAFDRDPAGDFELYAAVGEIDCGGGEGCAPGGDGDGEFDDCGEPFGAAER